MKILRIIFLILLAFSHCLWAQKTQRPMIWVKPADKAAILQKISEEAWAAQLFEAFQKRVAQDVQAHSKDPKVFFSDLPFTPSTDQGQIPAFRYIRPFKGNYGEDRTTVMRYLQIGIDCGILYFLTDQKEYGQLSADILHQFIEGLFPLQISEKGHNGGGLLYPDDHLREAREIGAQIPILYDFAYDFIQKGGKVFNSVSDKKENFSHQKAEKVFQQYIKMALEHGIINCNWPVLESSSLVGNTLALDDENERKKFLEFYLTKNTPNQDALLKVAKHYLDNGGKWPESPNYATGVASYSTYLMTLLTKSFPELALGKKYPQIPKALSTNYALTYPNKTDMVIFGDGHRPYHPAYEEFEVAYYLGVLEQDQDLQREFGALLHSAMNQKEYRRGILRDRSFQAEVYTEPLSLLWFCPKIKGELKDYPLPTTDELAFAGMYIQRNLGYPDVAKNSLMAVTAGGSHVHGHASGMSMELYGKGFVLGQKAGRASYTTDIHENYYRLFAGHNTVIVNGASQSEGGWANLGTNTVEKIVTEPEIMQKPISPNHSYICTAFKDDKGNEAEALQERHLGIVRTSPTTAYYIDVFRSKSALPNQYHDYLYHNIGESLSFENINPTFKLKNDPDRYLASAQKEWVNNKKHRHPGWHFFKEVKTAENYSEKLAMLFTAANLTSNPIHMRAFVNAGPNRDYTSVMAPPSSESYGDYKKAPTPTIVIRQRGEAWDLPFAVVYEPFEGNNTSGSIVSVEQILVKNKFKGLKITSKLNGQTLLQYALIQEHENDHFKDKKLGIDFTGRYAILSYDAEQNPISIYIGQGRQLRLKNIKIDSKDGRSGAANLELSSKEIVKNSSPELTIHLK